MAHSPEAERDLKSLTLGIRFVYDKTMLGLFLSGEVCTDPDGDEVLADQSESIRTLVRGKTVLHMTEGQLNNWETLAAGFDPSIQTLDRYIQSLYELDVRIPDFARTALGALLDKTDRLSAGVING